MARPGGQDSIRTDEIGFGTGWNPDILDPDRSALPNDVGPARNESELLKRSERARCAPGNFSPAVSRHRTACAGRYLSSLSSNGAYSSEEVYHCSLHVLVVILMAMDKWIRLCSIADCPPGEAREFVVEDRIIALFHTADSFFALDGVCPHQGGPLGKGKLSGTIVTCPWHGWQFDVRTGQHCTNASVLHPHLDVRVINDEVQVALSTDGNSLP